MVSSSLKKDSSFRAVELVLQQDLLAQEVAEIVGAAVLPTQEREVVKAIPPGTCVGAHCGADRLVCACGDAMPCRAAYPVQRRRQCMRLSAQQQRQGT